MAGKRGDSGLSLIVAVDKPSGMTSHDVVNACRRIFGERRVGHTGTLDPMASGVLPVCIGPAARLDRFMACERKAYEARIVFGTSTTTDDAEGEVLECAPVPDEVADPVFALRYAASLIGRHEQMPPAYSAIKVNGKKAYDLARKGEEVRLQPRDIEVFDARLVGVGFTDDGSVFWDVAFDVSKGTYIRSLARDIGADVGSFAHLGALKRTSSGAISLDDCVTLEELEALKTAAALDPVHVLGVRFAFIPDALKAAVENGNLLKPDALDLFTYAEPSVTGGCGCTGSAHRDDAPPRDGETVAAIADGCLKALYRFDATRQRYKPECVFSEGVSRGTNY